MSQSIQIVEMKSILQLAECEHQLQTCLNSMIFLYSNVSDLGININQLNLLHLSKIRYHKMSSNGDMKDEYCKKY